MGTSSKIEWTDKTWNPVVGCSHVSAGCDGCYAARDAAGRLKNSPTYAGLATKPTPDALPRFTGEIRLLPERLDQPLRWRTARRIFVNSMSDLFHPDVPDEYVVRAFAVMAAAEQHQFQVLTKRPNRMRAVVGDATFVDRVWSALDDLVMDGDSALSGSRRSTLRRRTGAWLLPTRWPLPNVWLGTSVEDQRYANIRIPQLLATPAAVRFLSIEPLLGPVDPSAWIETVETCETCEGSMSIPVPGGGKSCPDCLEDRNGQGAHTTRPIDWVIVGGESGPRARPMHPQWARDLRDQCVDAGVPFLFKQWGEWAPVLRSEAGAAAPALVDRDGRVDGPNPSATMYRVGKKAAGRELDGRTWDEYPTTGG